MYFSDAEKEEILQAGRAKLINTLDAMALTVIFSDKYDESTAEDHLRRLATLRRQAHTADAVQVAMALITVHTMLGV